MCLLGRKVGCHYPTRALDLLGQHFSEAIQATGNKQLYGTCCHHEKSYGNQYGLQFAIHATPLGSGEDARPFP